MKLAFIDYPHLETVGCSFVADFSSADEATQSMLRGGEFQQSNNGPVVALSEKLPDIFEKAPQGLEGGFQQIALHRAVEQICGEAFELGRQYEREQNRKRVNEVEDILD